MSIAEDVETLARELGFWLCTTAEFYVAGDGESVLISGPSLDGDIRLPYPEAALFLRCVASGLKVELPCSDCEGSKVETKRVAADRAVLRSLRAKGWTVESKGYGGATRYTASRPCPTCSEPGPEVECGAGCWEAIDGTHILTYTHPDTGATGPRRCLACKGTGKLPDPGVPTGREPVGLAAAWLRGRPVEVLGYGRGADIDEAKADALWEIEALGADPSKALEKDRPFRDGDMLAVTYAAPGPGDPSTREALMVLADKRQSEGDPLGELLALDLAGAECPGGCDHQGYVYPSAATYCPCPACEGHGTALAQWQREFGTAAHPAASLTAAVGA